MKRVRSTNSYRKLPCFNSFYWTTTISIVLLIILSVNGLAPHNNCHGKNHYIYAEKKLNTNALSIPPKLSCSISIPTSRRSLLDRSAWNVLSIAGLSSTLVRRPPAVLADDTTLAVDTITTTTTPLLYRRQIQDLKPPQTQLSYEIKIPPSMYESTKPVKTHLDEVNFLSESIKGYQYGITVDPVRITSIKEVGLHVSLL
jgi:hypothetical protein